MAALNLAQLANYKNTSFSADQYYRTQNASINNMTKQQQVKANVAAGNIIPAVNSVNSVNSNSAKRSTVASSASSAQAAAAAPSGMSIDDIYNRIASLQEANNAKSYEMVKQQQAFNAIEAQKNRDWQQMMSSTAHQRETADLLAAGLNPVLSAGGTGAAVTSGATASGAAASPDTSGTAVIGQYLKELLASATAINSANIYANSNMAAAAMAAQANMYSANTSAQAAMRNADVNAATSRYGVNMQTSSSILNGLIRMLGGVSVANKYQDAAKWNALNSISKSLGQ